MDLSDDWKDELLADVNEWEDQLEDNTSWREDLPLYYRECCGVNDVEAVATDTAVTCERGKCKELFCRCGVTTFSGWGEVNCPCQKRPDGHWNPAERRMLKVPNGKLHHRKYRARKGR